MFRKQLTEDLRGVFGFDKVRICGLDDETEVLYFQPSTDIVSTPIMGSGKTHFRVYGTIFINQDEANGVFGIIHHKLLSSNHPAKSKFMLTGDEKGLVQNLYDQHRVISSQDVVWESDVDWNDAPEITGGIIDGENIPKE